MIYLCSFVRHCPSAVPQPFSKSFSSETAWPTKDEFQVEPPWKWGSKVCINCPGHVTKMTAVPVYGKSV